MTGRVAELRAAADRPVEFDSGFRARLRDLLAWRRDVRRFSTQPLPKGTLERLISLACLSPSVGLSQPWRFVIVEDAARRVAIRRNFQECNTQALAAQSGERAAAYGRLKLAGLNEAPCQLAVFADPWTLRGHGLGRGTMPETIEYSAVAAVHTIWLAARSEGIGMGWVSILDPAAVIAILGIPSHWKFIGYLCLGFPLVEDDVPALERAGWENRQMDSAFVLRR
jgi:5,6-dimethylbenzimidazole synthase